MDAAVNFFKYRHGLSRRRRVERRTAVYFGDGFWLPFYRRGWKAKGFRFWELYCNESERARERKREEITALKFMTANFHRRAIGLYKGSERICVHADA